MAEPTPGAVRREGGGGGGVGGIGAGAAGPRGGRGASKGNRGLGDVWDFPRLTLRATASGRPPTPEGTRDISRNHGSELPNATIGLDGDAVAELSDARKCSGKCHARRHPRVLPGHRTLKTQ